MLPNARAKSFTYYLWEGVVKKEFIQQEHDELQDRRQVVGGVSRQVRAGADDHWRQHTHKDGTVSRPTSIRSIPGDRLHASAALQRDHARRSPRDRGRTGLRKAVCVATRLLKPRSAAWKTRCPKRTSNNDRGASGNGSACPRSRAWTADTIAERLGGEMLRIAAIIPATRRSRSGATPTRRNARSIGDSREIFASPSILAPAAMAPKIGPTRSTVPACVASRSAAQTFTTRWRKLRTSASFSIWLADSAAECIEPIKRKSRLADIRGRRTGGVPAQQGRLTWSFQRTAKQIPYEKK